MYKKVLYLLMIMAVLLALPSMVEAEEKKGVDDLRGRWEFTLNPDEGEDTLRIFFNELVPSENVEDEYRATGCMLSPDSQALMPLSMVTTHYPEESRYEMTIVSTIVPPQPGKPFLIRLSGEVLVFGDGVSDDRAEGFWTTDFREGAWTAYHHDRRKPKCPEVQDPNIFFHADVYAHHDLATTEYFTLLEGFTIIASSAMRVTAPDGEIFIVEPYKDIFSPEVDFIGNFRFLTHMDEAPIAHDPYTFTLLDILGNPIAGTESFDIWTACNTDAPSAFSTAFTSIDEGEELKDFVEFSWLFVPDVTGEFEPGESPQIGFYQIGVSPFNYEGNTDYGASGIASAYHNMPVFPFDPGREGNPDGTDFGVGLGELEDGTYAVQAEAFSEPNPGVQAGGSECSVYDTSQRMFLLKEGSNLVFAESGSITGRVVNEENNGPIPGVFVQACTYDDVPGFFCQEAQTNENGAYGIFGLPAGEYRVGVQGQAGWSNEFYDNKMHHDADQVAVYEGLTAGNINFSLFPAGSISGTVFDEFGVPLENIAVDTEEGGYGTCTDENGNYILEGVPFGTTTIVAGRDFCDPHNYVQDQQAVIIDTINPDAEGVDFYLILGGSISGVVTEGTDPVVGSNLVACQKDIEDAYCNGTQTNEYGSYTIGGLPAGDYVVFVLNEIDEPLVFYDNKADYESADAVSVTVDANTGGINFNLSSTPE